MATRESSNPLVAIILSSTSLGIVIPVLADAGQSNTALGQLIIAGSSIADFGAIILLSLFFSEDSTSVWSTLLLIGGFVVLVIATGLALVEAEHSSRLSLALARLQDSSAKIRVQGALLLLIGFVVVAQLFGLELIPRDSARSFLYASSSREPCLWLRDFGAFGPQGLGDLVVAA